MADRSHPRLLILETSGRMGQVALARGPDVLAVRRLDEARSHARDLAPALSELLAAQGWRPRQVDAVVVSRGPGSYTGLRVGIMSAKTIAYATGCVLIALETFAAVAEQAPPAVQRLDVLADAQQDKVYVQSFGRASMGWQALTPLAIRRYADWLAGRHAETWVSGPGLIRWESRLPAGVPRVAAGQWEPQAESLLRLALPRLNRGERDDIYALEPLYLRPSSAEEQWHALGRP
jgi:tRNA threonylcarbamoyladenosine biosynthesis protein TsaB